MRRLRAWPTLLLTLAFGAGGCMAVESTPTAAPDPAPGRAGGASIYGSGIRGDGKSNAEIGRSWGDIALRFRASSSAAPRHLIWPAKTGDGGYSGGDGGTIRIGVMGDDGSARHHPDGKWLVFTDVKPGNPGTKERYLRTDFSGAPALVAGRLYHVVFRNISADPYSDWVSVNTLSMRDGYDDYSPRQPAFADTDLEFLREGPSDWKAMDWKGIYYTPHFDLALADGTHEGNAYGIGDRHYDRLISGTTQMVRERFTVSGGDKTVTAAYVAIARQSGGGDVTIRLEDASGARIDSITVPGSHIPASTLGERLPAAQEWVGGAFARAHTLANGETYRLRVHSESGSTYFARPIFSHQRAGEAVGSMRSRRFVDGASSKYGGGEYTTDGGASWNGMYHHSLTQDLQFYFVTR